MLGAPGVEEDGRLVTSAGPPFARARLEEQRLRPAGAGPFAAQLALIACSCSRV